MPLLPEPPLFTHSLHKRSLDTPGTVEVDLSVSSVNYGVKKVNKGVSVSLVFLDALLSLSP